MKINRLKPRKALNKAFLKVKPNRAEIESFKTNLIQLLDRTNVTESEEFHKNLVIDFLKKTYYDPNHFINTKGRNDLVIHNGDKAKSTVGVIIEAKKPTNKSEMVTTDKLNAKAFQELVLYYLRERITQNNIETKHLIITNINEWFIFDATTFDRLFAQNKTLVKHFNDFENGRLADTRTDFFYKQIAEPFIAEITAEIEFTHFNLQDYQKPLRNDNKADDNKLIALFKLLSPEHLLKLPFTNDSNSLDKRFYSELLHIIGLTETKEGSKKLIGRNKEGERNTGSILEDAVIQLDSLDKISRLERPSQFGNNQQEKLFNVALELTITWINRILFLKLLEAQLITYHKGDKSYSFLNLDKIKSYDDLNSLFFQVLARKQDERNPDVKQVFEKVPYLNSSLFEPTEIEQLTLFISNLKDDKTIPIISSTILKNEQGKKRTGKLSTLEYLFAFLNAYDFSSEGSEAIQEENKSLINASVLGLIFEKINGYKDGSFFTPGFITMYMCRETIRKAVVQKFNEIKKWKCKDLKELYNQIEDSKEANEIVNSLKICDPAVGSGHFLVSALNEIIAVKNDLKILQDRNGKRLKEYQVEVVNDELIVTDEEGELFDYNHNSKESQRIQETLFHEKQTIIENCLFGVDINPNSVKICRLRLWIELLKNAYYKNSTELETLPNIDINIKCGNSLVSRFDIDADLKKALRKSKWTIDSYQIAVDTYRNAQSKEQKREMERLIDDIKSDFRSEISMNDPKVKKLRKLSGELFQMSNQGQLFEMSKREKAAWNKKVAKLTKDSKKLETEIEEIKANKIYENAFEWRFEFPEVLNDDGDFVGFDVVIGNPPYIRQEELGDFKAYLKSNFKVYVSSGDIFSYFYELSYNIIRKNGYFSFINNTFDKTTAGKTLRTFTTNNFSFNRYIDFTDVVVFEEATTYPIILIAQKADKQPNFKFLKFTKHNFENKDLFYDKTAYIEVAQDKLNSTAWNFISPKEQYILEKIGKHQPLRELYGKCYYGIKTALNEAFITNIDLGDYPIIKDVYEGKDMKKWASPIPDKKMIVFESKSTKKAFGDLTEDEALIKMQENYPEIFSYLEPFTEKALRRYDKGDYWWELRNCAYYDLFEQPKIIFPNLQNSNKFAFDDTGTYLNAPAVFLPTSDKSLLAILNSKLVWYFLKSICVIRSGGYIEVKPQYFEQIPIPKMDEQLKQKLSELSKEAIDQTKENPKADTTYLETRIDNLVYELYELTEEEIKIIDESIPSSNSLSKTLEPPRKKKKPLNIPNPLSEIVEKSSLGGLNNIWAATEPLRKLTEKLEFKSPLSDLIEQQNKFPNLGWHSDLLKATQPMRDLMEAVKIPNPMADFIESQRRITEAFKPNYLSSISDSINTIQPYKSLFNYSPTLDLLNSIQNIPAIEAVKSINQQYDSIFGSIHKISEQTNQFQKTLAEINSWRFIIDRVNWNALKTEDWEFIQDFQKNTETLFNLSEKVLQGEISQEEFLEQSKKGIENNREWVQKNNWWLSFLFFLAIGLYQIHLSNQSTDLITSGQKEIKTENKEIRAEQKNILNLVQEIASQQKDRFIIIEENTPVHISFDESSEILDSLPKLSEVIVSYKEGDWSFVSFKNEQDNLPKAGWVETSNLKEK